MDRLQKILSQAGIASRRASEKLMLEGRVSVNGTTVTELGTKADAARDDRLGRGDTDSAALGKQPCSDRWLYY